MTKKATPRIEPVRSWTDEEKAAFDRALDLKHDPELDMDPRPVFRLPHMVEVVGQRYNIQVIEDQHEALGRCNGNDHDALGLTELQRGYIRIRGGGEQSEDQARDTLLHEVLHVVDYVVNGLDDQLPEAVVARISTVLLHTLRTNPELVAAIISK